MSFLVNKCDLLKFDKMVFHTSSSTLSIVTPSDNFPAISLLCDLERCIAKHPSDAWGVRIMSFTDFY